MTDPEFTSQEQHLIDQLRQSPAPRMNPDAVERLRQQLFDEVDLMQGHAAEQVIQHPSHNWLLLMVIVGLLLLTATVFFVLNNSAEMPPPTETPTSTLTVTPMPTTATSTQTHTATATTVTTLTVTPSLQPSTTAHATTTTAPLTIIEGAIVEAGTDYIIIFDLLIETDQLTDAASLMPGLIVRVEGESRIEGNRVVIRAIQITSVELPAANTGTGQQSAPPPPPVSADDRDSRSSRDS